jgi:hypothetical protein
MVFKKKYTDEDFLAVISDVPCTTECVIRKVGCSRTTALRYLTLLEKEGRILSIEIEGSSHEWIRKKEGSTMPDYEERGLDKKNREMNFAVGINRWEQTFVPDEKAEKLLKMIPSADLRKRVYSFIDKYGLTMERHMLMIAFYRELVKPELDDCSSIEERYTLAADNLEEKLIHDIVHGNILEIGKAKK